MGKKTFSAVFFPFLNDGGILGLVQIIHFTDVLNEEKKYKGLSNTNQYQENGIFYMKVINQLGLYKSNLSLICYMVKA